MSYSLNEFEALALKAARGAGLPWGLAEEAGKAVRILSSFGFDAGPVLLEALKAPKHEYNGLMCGPSRRRIAAVGAEALLLWTIRFRGKLPIGGKAG